jgi:hypothetical protein
MSRKRPTLLLRSPFFAGCSEVTSWRTILWSKSMIRTLLNRLRQLYSIMVANIATFSYMKVEPVVNRQLAAHQEMNSEPLNFSIFLPTHHSFVFLGAHGDQV